MALHALVTDKHGAPESCTNVLPGVDESLTIYVYATDVREGWVDKDNMPKQTFS